MPFPCLQPHARGVSLLVQAVPRASRTEVVDFPGDRCKIKVKAPPVEGEANEALIAFLAKLFGLPKQRVTLERGAHGKLKLFLLNGFSPAAAQEVLAKLAGQLSPGGHGGKVSGGPVSKKENG